MTRTHLDMLGTTLRLAGAFRYASKRGWMRPTQIEEALDGGEAIRQHESKPDKIAERYEDAVERMIGVLIVDGGYEPDDRDLFRELAVDLLVAALRGGK